MATISFDFDGCLWDEKQNCFINETVFLMRGFINSGNRIIIVTSRIQKWADESKVLISKHLNLDLEVFSAPGNADDYRCGELLKSDVLIMENAIKHFDDIPNDNGLLRAKNNGIEILLPPATHATITGMY